MRGLERREWRDGKGGAAVLEPDVLLPGQWAGLYAKERSSPYARLYLGLLEDAVETLRRYQHVHDARGGALFREAREWFEDWQGHTRTYPVTCEQTVLAAGLTVDPEVLAARVLRTYAQWDSRHRVTRMRYDKPNYLGPRKMALKAGAAC